jgi:hypothetical protein
MKMTLTMIEWVWKALGILINHLYGILEDGDNDAWKKVREIHKTKDPHW